MTKIKQLEWNKDSDSYHWSECPIGNFVVTQSLTEDTFHSLFGESADEADLHGIGTYKTLDEAKAACQSHFENVVQRCLEA